MTFNEVDRDVIAQVVNQGGDVPDGNFDLQMGDGGFCIYDACVSAGTSLPKYDGSAFQWGTHTVVPVQCLTVASFQQSLTAPILSLWTA
jgi:hypothetical protein